jgi:hypothetical protein
LVGDLGLEPSAGLRRLQQAILKTSEPTPGIPGVDDARLVPVG